MARSLNGGSDHIDFNNVAQLKSQAFTFSCWVYFTSLSGTPYLFTSNATGDANYGVVCRQSGTALEFRIRGGADLIRTSASSLLSTSVWTHIVFTHDGSTTATNAKLYINGSEVSYAAGPTNGSSPAADGGKWCVGGRSFDTARTVAGYMANIGVWDHVKALAEIGQLADGFSPLNFRRGLLFAPPLIREARDPVTGQTGTLTGTSVIDHPRTIPVPYFRTMAGWAAAGGGSFKPAWVRTNHLVQVGMG